MNALAQISATPVAPWNASDPGSNEEPFAEPAAPAQKTVLLVDETAMTRECLAHMLQAESSDIGVRSVARPDDAAGFPCPQLILLNINSARINDPAVIARIEAIRLVFEDVPIVVIAHLDDSDMAFEAIRYDLRGYIPTSLNPDLMVAAIRLVLAGGIFIPQNLVARYSLLQSPPDDAIVSDQQAGQPFGLTQREDEVMRHLREGKPNKVIAFALGISESTVKVHLRNIMRKLHATNRTQAVLRG
jgi:DNA-binding NarL/FixJ family response regulator